MQTHHLLWNPYASIGAGWLLQAHTGVKNVPNAEYDPNHICPEGSSLTMTKVDNLDINHQLAFDLEVGILIGKGRVKGQIGIAYMRTQQATKYPSLSNTLHSIEEPKYLYHPEQNQILAYQESSVNQNALQWNQHKVHPLVLKIGVSFRIYTDPHRVRLPTDRSTSVPFCTSEDSDSGGSGCGK